MAKITVPHPPCVYCDLPVPISDNSEYTILNLGAGFRYAHNRCADSAARDPFGKPPIQSVSVGRSLAPRKDCA